MTSALREYWPQHGSIWAEWKDLQLAIQFATLRSGFSGSARNRTAPTRYHFRCRHERKTGNACTTPLISTVQEVAEDGTTGWKPDIDLVDGAYDRSVAAGNPWREALINICSRQDDDEADNAQDPQALRERAKAPSPISSPDSKQKILPTPSPSIERSPSPAPSGASASRSRSASPDDAASRSAFPQPAHLDSDAEDDQAVAGADEAASPSANSSIWSSISHRALLLARAESRLPSLRSTVSRLESELEAARRKLQKQEGIVERRKGRIRREMRRALGGERGEGKVGKGKKEKEGKKRRKGKKRASPEL
ncbi:Plus agglutinin [Rhodotorula toruloides ATCC 204091]|uniref:BY PROTMAP: gi/342321661/gb/EGU13593.1/ Plus agglutinin [Rhodotorula glutinis ATCC 204091] n=1 Tax=Rhodotorula toruloides TaxID=5286 RepID=A0A0K3CCP1_RHOTO|nr:Plus agglutinin [Rhodotorula toruloides ATCC 204091]KAK4335035.1 Plus agglutinin [Rhodotorula toruloides]PRQ76461.1 hypothetical protein AAT19DRAFT_13483 [Rhodotorula toruloides]